MTLTITEEQREASDNLREAMRMFNHAIRRQPTAACTWR